MNRTFKTLAIAAFAVFATASASMAATYAWVDHPANVKQQHQSASVTVNHVMPGQKVKVIGKWGSWYKLQIPGPDGWVKGAVLDFAPKWKPWPKKPAPYSGGSFCVNGKNASFCISGGY